METRDTFPRPDRPDTDVTRRDFLVRAGLFGGALTLFSRTTSIVDGVVRQSAHALHTGPTALAAPAGDLSPLFSGLQWRLLGPFRGGKGITGIRVAVALPKEDFGGNPLNAVPRKLLRHHAGRVCSCHLNPFRGVRLLLPCARAEVTALIVPCLLLSFHVDHRPRRAKRREVLALPRRYQAMPRRA